MSRAIERTCCICRSKADKRELFRLVCCGGALVWDVRQSAPGRGAYVHPSSECVSKAGSIAKWEYVLKLTRGTLTGPQVQEVARSLLREVHSRVSEGGAKSDDPLRRKGVRL